MASVSQLEYTRCTKRPRHGDYNPDSIGGQNICGTAFETPRTTVSSDAIPLTIPTASQNNGTIPPNLYNIPYSVEQWPESADTLSHFIMEDNGNLISAHIELELDYELPPGALPDNVEYYTHDSNSVAGQWSVSPGLGAEHSDLPPGGSNTALPLSNPPSRTPREGPTEQEWEEHRPLIMLLYGPEKPSLNLTLPELKRVMDEAGFLKGATENMYKNRFLKWDVVKNKSNAHRRQRTRRQQQQQQQQQPSPGRVTASACLGPSEAQVTLKTMFETMRTLCAESIKQKVWALEDEFCVIDDDWEDAYGSAAALILELHKNPNSSASSGWETIRDEIAPMVKTLNYFSLPTILIIAFKMCKQLGDPRVRHVAADFLRGCLEIARAESARSPRHASLAGLLQGLYHVAEQHSDLESLADMLQLTIPCYIGLVNNHGSSESATALSLLSLYHVQLKSDELWLESTLSKILRLLKRAEAAKGEDHKATIEIMGLAIMVLQGIKQQGKKLAQLCCTMRIRMNRQLSRIPAGNPDRAYFLDRLLDGYHLEIRQAQEDGEDEYAATLEKEYRRLEVEHGKEKDGYAKILDLELKGLTSQLEGTSLS